MSDIADGRQITFVVRIRRTSTGDLHGVVERVATRQKEVFRDVAEIAAIIARLTEAESPA